MNRSHEMLRKTILACLFTAGFASACRSSAEPSATGAKPATPALAELALAYAADGETKSDERIRSAQHLVRTQPRVAKHYLELSRALVQSKRERGEPVLLAYAADALSAAEAIDPQSPEALALRGVLLREDHKFRELAALADTLIAADSKDTTGYLLLGDAKLELGDYDGAAEAYDQAMERYPDLRVYARGAHLRWLHGDVDGALEMMDAALESADGNREHLAWCLTDVGTLFLNQGQVERAIAAADAAAKLVGGYPAALALRGRAEMARGNYDAAARAIRAALAVRSSAADHFSLAEIEEALGNAAAASKAASTGLALAEHEPIPAARYLARRGEQTDRAVALATNEVAKRPTVAAYAASALANERAGNTDAAAEAIEKALRLGTPLAELHLTGGLIKLARGDADGARRELAHAKQLNPHADPRLVGELEASLEAIR